MLSNRSFLELALFKLALSKIEPFKFGAAQISRQSNFARIKWIRFSDEDDVQSILRAVIRKDEVERLADNIETWPAVVHFDGYEFHRSPLGVESIENLIL